MILAAGVGSRLDPLTRNIPKPMVPIINKPVMEHIVDLLRNHGFNEIMVNLHHLGDQIEEYFGDGSRFGVEMHYSKEEQLLGTAGGLKKVEDFFDSTFVVIGGDDLADIDLTRGLAYHRKKGAVATIALSLVDHPAQYGIVSLDENGKIRHFIEKPREEEVFSNTANTGVYIFEPEVLELIPRSTFYDFGKNLFPLLHKQNMPFYGWLTNSYWCDVGNINQYRQAHNDALADRVRVKFPAPETRKYTWIGENVEIDPTAEIGYPVLIGDNCRIEAHARVLENSVLGDNVVLEEGATVKESILWKGARVMKDTILERCVVGFDCGVNTNAAIFDGVIVSPFVNGDTNKGI